MPVGGSPVPMGMHGEVAAHYRLSEADYEPHPTTLDYLVGSTVACLTGTLGGMVAALGQTLNDGALTAHGEGVLTKDAGTLRITEIRVAYRLRLDPGVDPDRVREAWRRHTSRCPVARTLGDCVAIDTSMSLV